MSQSEEHQQLVNSIAKSIKTNYGELIVISDLQKFPGDEIPPLISGFRPDVYAYDKENLIVIAEAKTDTDIDNKHTYDQLRAFIEYLEKDWRKSIFVFAVNGSGVDRAKTVLRFLCKEIKLNNTQIQIFDTYDHWFFDSIGGVKWHLN